jgi:hypothetical protein
MKLNELATPSATADAETDAAWDAWDREIAADLKADALVIPAAQAKERFKLLQENPAHPQLHFKEFRTTGGGIHNPGTFSVRIDANHRALGTEVAAKPLVIVWWFIGDHSAYMKVAEKGRYTKGRKKV